MIETLLDTIGFPIEKLKLMPCEMVTTMNYVQRMERNAPPEVESSCGPARPMLLAASSGSGFQEYLGLGDKVLQVYPIRREEDV